MSDLSSNMFKKRRRPQAVKTLLPDSSGLEKSEDISEILQETREIQKSRRRLAGIEVSILNRHCDEEVRVKNSGLSRESEKETEKVKAPEEKDYTNIKNAFLTASDKVDDELLMWQYIEEQMNSKNKIKGERATMASSSSSLNPKKPSVYDYLYEVPESLKVISSKKRAEDMLSNQMLTGIPEVSLGIEARIKNLEEIENALSCDREKRKKLLKDANAKHYNRFEITDTNRSRTAVNNNYLGDDD